MNNLWMRQWNELEAQGEGLFVQAVLVTDVLLLFFLCEDTAKELRGLSFFQGHGVLYQGTTFSRAAETCLFLGFSPCTRRLSQRACAGGQ